MARNTLAGVLLTTQLIGCGGGIKGAAMAVHGAARPSDLHSVTFTFDAIGRRGPNHGRELGRCIRFPDGSRAVVVHIGEIEQLYSGASMAHIERVVAHEIYHAEHTCDAPDHDTMPDELAAR